MLVTHAHPDHFHWPAWMWRGWAAGNRPVVLVAPPAVLEVARPHLDPTVTTVAAEPGGRLGFGGVLFGRKNPYRRYGKLLRRRLDPARRWRIGISHANVPEGAAAVRRIR